MKHNLTLVILTPEQIARAREANGRRKRITHALVCGPYGQMFGTEQECLKYFTLWDPDHRIEVAPGQSGAARGRSRRRRRSAPRSIRNSRRGPQRSACGGRASRGDAWSGGQHRTGRPAEVWLN